MLTWNVCLTHDPAYAGLYRGVNDFAAAMKAETLSFDDGRCNRSSLSAVDGAKRIVCGSGWLTRDCHRISPAAMLAAEQIVAEAELLVVHSLFRAHAPWAADWARRHRRRYWAVPHGCLDPWGLSQRRIAKQVWLRWQGRGFLGGAERIIFSTLGEMEKALPWLDHLGATDRATVVHWPVSLPALDGRSAARETFRFRHGIPLHAPLLLYVGRLHSMKRPIETVAAFCASGRSDAHLAMIGMNGDLKREDIEKAVNTDCRDRVHVIGPLSGGTLAEAWLAGDGFISLSCRENFGYAAAEAVAYGLPVILSAGHDLAWEMPLTSDGRFACGWLLRNDSLRTAADAIFELTSRVSQADPQLPALSLVGREWVEHELSPASFTSRLQQLKQGV